MNRYTVKFHFHHSVHLGSDVPGIGEESSKVILHSDTIFSALCNVWAQIDWYLQSQGCIPFQEILDLFKSGKPPFKISSGFPFSGMEYYLPKPLIESKSLYSTRCPKSQLEKDVKKVRFIPLEYFMKWIVEKDDDMGFAEKLNENKNFGIRNLIPKTPVNRIDNSSNIYHTENYFFNNLCGLYTIVEIYDDNLKKHLESVLKHIELFGLGGNRNTGQGALKKIIMKAAPDEMNDLFDLSSNFGYCLISLYYPLKSLLTKEALAYELTLRKGWIGTHSTNKSLKKRTCYMFSEGSMFSDIDMGKLVDTKPKMFNEHEVWQYGYSMTIPTRKSNENQ